MTWEVIGGVGVIKVALCAYKVKFENYFLIYEKIFILYWIDSNKF